MSAPLPRPLPGRTHLRHSHYMKCAEGARISSLDPSTQVGCVIVCYDGFDIVGTGYNSFPSRSQVSLAVYSLKQEKYDRIIHAEMRALLRAGKLSYDGTLYSTLAPCKDCAKHIAEAGIRRVVYPRESLKSSWAQRFPKDLEVAHDIFDECGVEVVPLDGP